MTRLHPQPPSPRDDRPDAPECPGCQRPMAFEPDDVDGAGERFPAHYACHDCCAVLACEPDEIEEYEP